MCGIAGFYSPNGQNSSITKHMTDTINHRGPDDSGALYFENLKCDPILDNTPPQKSILSLGHRRLSILDLSAKGHQPMCYKKRYWITYNGEIYNYIELREELESLGHSFVSSTDTEVIIAAYDEWGEACQKRFNGMWAFAIYDASKNTLFLSRDRFGIKPLYYWISPDSTFYFASEIKQFTVLPGWQANLNHQRAYDFLVWGISDHTDETMFDGVFQLRPSHVIEQHLEKIILTPHKKIQTKKWYSLKSENTDDSFEMARKKLRDLLKSSVNLRLRSDVTIGSCLSGGIDSSSIVCLMNNILKENNSSEKQKTFSACSREEKVDERKWIDKVVNSTNIETHYTYPEIDNVFELLPKLTWHQDEPFGSSSIFAQWEVFALAAKNKTSVMLDGQGADEQLAGYHSFFGAHLADMLRDRRFIKAIKAMQAIRRKHGYSWEWIMAQTATNILPSVIKNTLRKITGRTHPKPNWLDMNILKASASNPHDKKTNGVKKLSHAQMTSTNLQMLLHWEDRDSMAHSIESRVPFLDYRLVEYVMSLPANYRISGEVTKRVLRESMRGIIPDEITDRIDKIGFATAEETWIRKQATEIFRKKIEAAIKKSQGLITKNALTLFEDIVTGHKPFSFVIWRIISFAEWIDTFSVDLEGTKT